MQLLHWPNLKVRASHQMHDHISRSNSKDNMNGQCSMFPIKPTNPTEVLSDLKYLDEYQNTDFKTMMNFIKEFIGVKKKVMKKHNNEHLNDIQENTNMWMNKMIKKLPPSCYPSLERGTPTRIRTQMSVRSFSSSSFLLLSHT